MADSGISWRGRSSTHKGLCSRRLLPPCIAREGLLACEGPKAQVLAHGSRSLRCMSPVLALSWLNLPRGPKAAIGIGKRTLAIRASLARAGGPWQGPAASAFFRKADEKCSL